MSNQNDHSHEEEAVVSIAAQMLADETATHEVTIGAERPGVHLELIDLTNGVSAEDVEDEWDFDLPADMGLKILFGGMEPGLVAQLLYAAAEYVAEAAGDEDDD